MFMLKISTKTAPSLFHPRFQMSSHSYATNFSESNYALPARNLRKIKFRISTRLPLLWNNFLAKTKKSVEIMTLFKNNLIKINYWSLKTKQNIFSISVIEVLSRK